MPRPAPPASPPTDELPSLDEGDECTEIFGRQMSSALAAGLASTREVPAAGSLDPGDDHTSPTRQAFDVSRSLADDDLDLDDVATRVGTAAVVMSAMRSVSVPEAPVTRDLMGAVPELPLETLSTSDMVVPEASMSSEVDLASTRPLPAAPAALLASIASIEHGSEPSAPASTRGPFGGQMTLTPLVPLLPSVASLNMTASTDRASALPPPRPPMLSPASLLMPNRGSSPPASSAPLGSSPPASFGSSSSVKPVGSTPPAKPVGSTPPAASLASSPPAAVKSPAAVKISSAGMDFDDATLVKTEEELPILLQRRKSTPPAGMPAASSDRTSSAPAAPAGEPETKRRTGLFGRLLSFVLG